MSTTDYQLPWTACEPGDYSDFGGDSIVILRGNSARRLCVVHGGDEEAIAAARLIEAAPNMLAALRRAALALAFAAEKSPAMQDDYKAVSDAIACATGVPA